MLHSHIIEQLSQWFDDRRESLQGLFELQARFLVTSVIATAFDYGLFLLLNATIAGPVASHTVSYPLAVLLNFLLQKFFIFKNLRNPHTAFALAMVFSALSWILGTALIFWLVKIPYFSKIPVLAKLIVTVVLFFFNFFMKRYAFEGRFTATK
jgi:putative flippase GtrA